MANAFSINMDDKPHLTRLKSDNFQAFKEVVATFVELMELAAEKQWYALPETIHSSLSFKDVVQGILNATMTTSEIDPSAFSALEMDLHPLSLLSDKRKNIVTGDPETYDWKSHFALDTSEISKETLEHIIRKIFYLVRWFDVESVSKSLITSQFPIIDNKDIMKLPFQPALRYQQEHLGDLYVGKFLHEIGAFNCGEIEVEDHTCPACNVGAILTIGDHQICPRCNAGFKIKEELEF